MLFQHTLPLVLSGRKTQTRRLAKPGEVAVRGSNHEIEAVLHAGREKWRVGKLYAVQPGRGQKQVAQICILAIREEKLLDIRAADARAEGFADRDEFLQVWTGINGKPSDDTRVWALEFELVAAA